MSLTAMARENALLERSTESNSAPSGTGIDLGDPAEAEFRCSAGGRLARLFST